MAHLARPPGLPSLLEGVLNLAGTAVPVLRLDRLFHLPLQRLGLYSMLIIVNGLSAGRVAMLVNRVNEVLTIQESALLPIAKEHSFNACAEATVSIRGEVVHLLSPTRILLQKECEVLSEFQVMAQQRLQGWTPQAL
jgi:purine-binding chemotaxis protein CheW